MTTLLTAADVTAEEREAIAQALAQPCACCGRTGQPVVLLIDHEDGPFALCAPCGEERGVAVLDVEPRTLAVLAADEHADRAALVLELARQWRNGCVPMSRRRLFAEARWPSA